MRDIPKSARVLEIKHRRRIRKLKMLAVFFVIFLFVITLLAYLSGDRRVTIDKFIITGTQIINQEDIEKSVIKDISGKYSYLFYKSNSFIYPHKKIYNNLISDFPRIEKLSISRDGLKTLKIDISERLGSYLYCGNNIPENKEEVGENCYFINNDGLIFDKAPYFSGNVYFKYYMSLNNETNNPLNKQMMDADNFYKMVRFIDGITSIGFNPIYLVKELDGTNYLYLAKDNSEFGPRIIFKDIDDLEILLDNLSIAMKKKEFANEINSKYNTLLYIDLRFKNKVLYKFE